MSPARDVEALLDRPLETIAGHVRAGDVRAAELAEAALSRVEREDGQVGAFAAVEPELALEQARALAPGQPAPLLGVPISVKDSKALAGHRLTFGSRFLEDHRATYDAVVVQRLKAAGCVPIGTSTVAEFGILTVTETDRYGPCRNPLDPARSAGGSSGGAAAGVAAGMVPLAHANDGAGSIRIPAACCGLVGLKPSRGRISLAPELGDSLLAVEGVISRTVAETALLLPLLAGPEPGDATWAPRYDPRASGAKRLRIAFTTAPPAPGVAVAPCARAACEVAAALCDALGHEVRPLGVRWPTDGLLDALRLAFLPVAAAGMQLGRSVRGREPGPGDVEPLSLTLWKQLRSTGALAYTEAVTRLQAIARAVVGMLANVDALITPALPDRPPKLGELTASADPLDWLERSFELAAFTAIANVTGQPAIVLPVRAAEHGDTPPTAVQLLGRPGGEAVLLRLAAELEGAAELPFRPVTRRDAPAADAPAGSSALA